MRNIFRRSIIAKSQRGDAMSEMVIPGRKERTFIENILRVPVAQMSDDRAYLETGSKRVWATFRACHITASALLTTIFKVVGTNTGVEATDPEIERLLKSPNPHDSWEELLYQWVFHMKLTGKAFWYKDQMDGRGRPKYLYPLLPHYIKIIPDEKKRISAYEYRVNGRIIIFSPEEIIFFRRPHPMSIISGMGDIEPSVDLFRKYTMKQGLDEKFLGNGAMPSGILTKDEEVGDEEEWRKIKEWWRTEYEGERNAGKTAFLNGKWTYLKLGLTSQEMQSIEMERWSVSQIFNNHGVPLSLAGLEKAANYATASLDERNFKRYEVVPLLDILVAKLNAMGPDGMGVFIQAFATAWQLVYELSGLIDVEQKIKEYRPLMEIGAITLNELRELCGLETKADPLLDQHMVTTSRIPLEMAGLSMLPSPSEGDGKDDEEKPGSNGNADKDKPKLPKPPKLPQDRPPKKDEASI